jgi:hypothetical protein
MTKWILRGVALAFGAVLALIGVRVAMHPRAWQPESLQYKLWKLGLLKLDRSDALAAFYEDRNGWDLIRGKTPSEISERFGRLLEPASMPPYYREFAVSPQFKDKKPRLIEATAWLISFDKNDKAVAMNLVTG